LIPFIRGVPLMALLVLATACGGDDKASSRETSSAIGGGEATQFAAETVAPADTAAPAETSPAEAVVESAAPADSTPAQDSAGTDSDAGQRLGLDAAPRLLAIDATVGVEVADVGEAVSQVVDLAAVHRGQVYDSDVNLTDELNARGTLVIKLPPDEVEAMIVALKSIGDVVTRTQNTDDVTDRLTDLEARIKTSRQSVDAVRLLMAATKDLNQIVLLENELNQRQTVLEELLAQQKGLRDRVALATLTVQLSKAPDPVEEEVVPKPTIVDKDTGVGEAFSKGWKTFTDAAHAVLVGVGYVAPFVVLMLLVALPVIAISRRSARRRNRSVVQQPQPAPAAGP
jgi:hypothetical protein